MLVDTIVDSVMDLVDEAISASNVVSIVAADVTLVVNQVEEALFAIYNEILSVCVPLLRLILVSRFKDKK